MNKIVISLIALTLSYSATAKVTYEDAVASSADYYQSNAAVNKPPREGVGLLPSELQDTSSGEGWTQYWSGSTTGGIGIPRSAKEVFVRYVRGRSITGHDTFPTNGGAVTFAGDSQSKNSNSENNDWGSCSVSALGQYSNFVISGGESSDKVCNASVRITGIMYR